MNAHRSLLFCLICFSFCPFLFAQDAPETLANKKIVILGDSSTTSEMWPSKLISLYLPSSAQVINTAQGGSGWGKLGSCFSVEEQWEKAKKQLGEDVKPNILILTTGGNCFPDSSLTYDDVITLCETAELNPDAGQMECAILALRKILSDCPELDVYLVANFYAGSSPAKDVRRRHYRTQLAALCDFYSCHLIDLTRNSGIRGRMEQTPEERIFTTDAVHLSTEKGKLRVARLIFAAVKANYPESEKSSSED